jgi:structural maintenance of chromosome 4
VAVCSAAPALDYTVVDSAATAQKCVELLRKNNLGVSTFLMLDKQQHLERYMREKVETPEGAPRLFDLIKPRDENARLAFYFALRDTLVCDTLEQASRIAYAPGNKRFRKVVTLKGELIQESGTMTGGGGKPKV